MPSVRPPGTAQHEGESVAPVLGSADIAQHLEMLVGRDAYRIERVEILGQAVDDGFGFGFEGPEQPVPYDQDAAVVPVDVLLIARRGGPDGATGC